MPPKLFRNALTPPVVIWTLMYEITLQTSGNNFLTLFQTVLHCYALDCASHALFNPSGTKSLDEKEDYVLMEDLSYDNRLQSKNQQYAELNMSALTSTFRQACTASLAASCLY